ncbi:uncharacterized protein si:ch73-103b9.2 [Boleophthalmus pectinirostris]|uniref:uncharacterized protein si:ch73-103b9.2 n=1 Tax=Boleophthalmus pectinirostris TaxID=150288 RepID=UPI0024326FEF|nr:uncharacterized protein si:ch73-103b9.2 [Boleophthalmus pectinirostris]
MANWKVVVSGPTEQCNETRRVERRTDKTPDRGHVNVLLVLSEEEFMKDLHPYKYQCNQGWEEAVGGWARVAPLAPLLLVEKTDNKANHKDVEHDCSTSVETDNLAEQPSETQLRPPTRLRSTISSQNSCACTKHNAPNQTPESSKISFVNGTSKQIAQLSLTDQTRDTRSPKSRKNRLKTNNALVPIKNFSFLPPINMPQNEQNFNKHQQGESGLEHFFLINKISRIRGTKGDLFYTTELPKGAYNETVSSKYRTCQHNPNYYSAVSVSVPKRYHVTLSSKPETLHPAGYSMSKTLHSGTAENRQVQMHPSCLYS